MNALELVRRSRGLKAKEVAEAIGVSVSVLSHVERGGRKPYPRLRRELARVLGVKEDVLFDSSGWPREVGEEALQCLKR
ncbi:MAG: helix-turn-helix domain-containing protein [Alicyclobacillus sp.]|uniref:helix-turn-helix transcriptional regulator n=1 Tax=Alicyclobacillus fructus TaxID=2816082 RepID=UPI001A8D558F|nr:helix-turn-helix transcriptional regulator [Alicyclobacillus fructus]MCL6442801.1 helix-turn-helix domain-containing protein [Alicyclobacillus sp.]